MSGMAKREIHSWLMDMDGVLVREEEPIPGAAEFLARIFAGGRRSLVPTRANGQPAFAIYAETPTGLRHGTGMLVLTFTGDLISALTRFESSVFPAFGLPGSLP